MKNILSLIILGIFLINLTSAVTICVDKTLPSSPSNLVLTASGNSIQLSWDSATDEPSCSGISHYEIYKNSAFLISVNETNYLDNENIQYGTYEYTIYAFDLIGHNEGVGISKTITISAPGENGGTPSGGGGGGGSSISNDVSYWQCGVWQECIEGIQTRTCIDLSKNLPNRTETKECFSDFAPLSYEDNESETSPINQESSSTNFLTGAVIGGVTDFVKSERGMFFVGLIVILTAFIIIRRLKLDRKVD